MKRIQMILDPGSFVEIGSGITARYQTGSDEAEGDGVITGYGTIDGAPVYIYEQNPSFLGGSLGEMHARKITALYNKAIAMHAPVVALIDCCGVRLNEANDALYSFGRLFAHQAKASGIVPQIAAVFGTCGGGMSISAAMSDFVFMEKDNGKMFLNSPNAVEGNYEEKCDSAAACFREASGGCDFAGSEEEICAEIRRLICMIPHSNTDDFSELACSDDLNRSVSGIDQLTDKREVIRQIADNGIFFETRKEHAASMITGFIRLNGITVGVVANGKQELCACGAAKAVRFIDFCDAFSVPVLTLTDVSGFRRNLQNEKKLPAALAKLTYAYANLTVPTVTVITGNAYGTAGVVMNSKSLGADIVYAWMNAKMGLMDKSLLDGITNAVDADVNSALYNARRGYLDGIIDPAETRQRVAAAFEMLYTKDAPMLPKKHGTI